MEDPKWLEIIITLCPTGVKFSLFVVVGRKNVFFVQRHKGYHKKTVGGRFQQPVY